MVAYPEALLQVAVSLRYRMIGEFSLELSQCLPTDRLQPLNTVVYQPRRLGWSFDE